MPAQSNPSPGIHVCPCCKQPVVNRPDPQSQIDVLKLTRRERQVAEFLLRFFGTWVDIRRIEDWLYRDDPDGGPDRVDLVTRVYIWRLGKKLKAGNTGLTIEVATGERRLTWVEP